MKKIAFSFWAFACGSCLAQTPVFTTVTTSTVEGVRTIDVPIESAARVVALRGSGSFLKDGVRWQAAWGDVIQGPVSFTLAPGISGTNVFPGLLTLEMLPGMADPNKTLILPQGTNSASVELESSTNLVVWSTATNGIYATFDGPRFFRIKTTASR